MRKITATAQGCACRRSICTVLAILASLRVTAAIKEIHISHECDIPLYIGLDGGLGLSAEYNFLFQVLLSRIYSTCRCNVQVADRWDLSRPGFMDTPPASKKFIVAASSDFLLNGEELSVLRNGSRGQHIVLLHLGDETLLHTDEASYSGVLQTMRNYYHGELGEASLHYLTTQRPALELEPRVLWLPLGFSKIVPLPEAFTSQRFSRRPLLWSWAGSLPGRNERYDMVRALEDSPRADALLALGRLTKFDKFAGADEAVEGSMGKWQYSITMHSTQFVPLPSGVSPEQYRLWEALEAGCIPILLEQVLQPGGLLYPVTLIGFHHIAISSWNALPALLWQLHEDLAVRPLHYDRMSQHNLRLWEAVKGRAADHVADLVCNA